MYVYVQSLLVCISSPGHTNRARVSIFQEGEVTVDHEANPSRQSSKQTGVSGDIPLAASFPKRVKMDGDGDGAPTSTHTSPSHQKEDALLYDGGGEGHKSSVISFDSSAESTPRKSVPKRSSAPSTPQSHGHDLSTVDMKMSWDGSASGGSAKGETTDGMLADPVKIAKEREKEERVRQARERLLEERKKKLEELREQQRIAQENREKQLEMRRRKIEDLRKRDSERRAAVEERRKMKEDIERARRESILQKAEERVARYEAWKAGGRKGGRGHIFGFGSATPRDICQPFERPRRSSSHSALQRRSPNGSDMDSMRPQRRALSACSAVRRHCCVDYNRIGMFGEGSPKNLSVSMSALCHKRNPEFSSLSVLLPGSTPGLLSVHDSRRSFLGPHTSASAIVAGFQHQQRVAAASAVGTTPTQQPRASMTASMPSPVRMRENKTRKQRPASVASSMPSFVGGEPAKTPRSKSTDRSGRDRSKTRQNRKDEKAIKDQENLTEKAQKSALKVDKTDAEKETEQDGEVADKKDKKSRVSLSFYDRLATPKYSKKDGDPTSKVDLPPKKETTVVRVQFAGEEDGAQDGMIEPELSPRKAYSTPNLSPMKKKSSIREKPAHKDGGPKQSSHVAKDTSRGVTPVIGSTAPMAPANRGISPGRKDKSASSTPRITPPPSANSTPTHTPSVPRASSPPGLAHTVADDGAPRAAPSQPQDITAEEYKARLAEKRRQAREKAEKEAEEERKRQDELWMAEQERLRKEEEEQKRLEEEAAEARRQEEERLQKAIEAEEKRRKEEAEKFEMERKAKEEAEKKAREEAEKLEKEKQEKAKRDEEERQARKKKLEMIMKRVKPESQADTSLKTESPSKSVSSSPNLSQVNSSQNSPDEHEKPVAASQGTPSDEEALPPVGSAVEIPSAAMTTSFILDTDEDSLSTSTVMTASFIRSASSNDILDTEEGTEEHDTRLSSSAATTPSRHEDTVLSSESTSETKSKFKSPLLQQLVEKKSSDSLSGGPKFKSPLLQNLLGKTKVGARIGMSSSTGDLRNKDPSAEDNQMSTSSHMTSHSSYTKELFNQDRDDEDKDEDTSAGTQKSFHSSLTNGVGKDSFYKSSTDTSPAESGGKLGGSNMSDSGIEPHMERELSAPGLMSQSNLWNGQEGHGMEDSSISLHSISESLTTSGFVFDSVPQSDETLQEGHLEDLLDLRDSKTSSLVSGAPILAFGENRLQDATESLS
ncbi:MAP7 domain-containing protein 1-like isoform X7 [Biomphalaria glabrata]|uniref:MAP7 domain-containing protein 1-like isoform X7 n=1 Tax=Biomphalaria glabrata TaxID=6526 RepID=A0A9W3AN20_BIOGL|nr:MAP7 domain-containing protein 1-like isoform X7 [Biomphalaria glabrata]